VTSETVDARLAAVLHARDAARRALEAASHDRGLERSEADLKDAWFAELSRDPTIRASGWYAPPPDGMSVLVGRPPSYERATFTSLRAPEKWPVSGIRVAHDSLLFVYCGPVDRTTGMIGDFQMSLYGGADKHVQEHVATTLEIVLSAVAVAEPGMELREVYRHAEHEMRARGVMNETYSSTDSSGATNIGHTVPWFATGASDTFRELLASGDGAQIAREISSARAFLTATQRLRIADTAAFTIEPQITSARGVLASFHVIVMFVRGVKHVALGFSGLFEQFGMQHFLSADALTTVRLYDRALVDL
jgi:hypothetical protein